MLMKRTLLIPLLVLSGALMAAAQKAPWPAGSFAEFLDVQLVNVEVFATDREGRPVLDLAAHEFTVYEDGEPVEVTNFVPPGAAEAERLRGGQRPESAQWLSASAAAPSEGVRLALFVDNVNTGPASRNRVFGQLWEVLKERLGAEDEVMVASYDGTLTVRLPFSRNRRQLLATLKEIETLSSGRLYPRQREQRAMELIEWRQQGETQGVGFTGDPCVDVGYIARMHADSIYNDVQRTIGAMTDFVNSLAGIPGRKVLLHVSDGIPLVPGAGAFEYAIEMCDGTGVREGLENAIDIDQHLQGDGRFNRFNPQRARLEMMELDTTEEWLRLAAYANAQRVTFYPLLASGLAAPSPSGVDTVRTTFKTDMNRRFNAQEALNILATETGGAAFFDTNDFRSDLHRVVDEARSSYELAYAAPHPGDSQRHEIRVEVARPGVRLRHRRSYQAKDVAERVMDGVLSSLLYGYQENPLEARLEIGGPILVTSKRSSFRVRIRVPLERLTLLPDGEGLKGIFSVYMAARDADGGTTPIGRKSIPLRIEATGLDRMPESEYVYEVEIELPRSSGAVAVAVRDELGGATSYLNTDFDLASES